MDIKRIEKLAQVMEEKGLCRLEISEGDVVVKLERERGLPDALSAGRDGELPQRAAMPFTPAAVDGSEQPVSPQREPGSYVTSPTVGVFYTASSPESEPFVRVGDKVKRGDVLCIIEAMKLMNEIPAEVDGTVAEICASNGQVVEYNQPLFRIV